jgi:von Willebrand factor A domain-containing protein 7
MSPSITNKRLQTISVALSIVFLILSAVSIRLTESVQAFVPTNLRAALLTSPFDETHQSITETAVKELDGEFFSIAGLTKPMKKAIERIVDADAEVDQDQVTSAKHFDGESFLEGQARVLSLLQDIQNALNADNALGARTALGQALHTIQDFYSHSNWVELGNGGPNPALGRPGNTIDRLAPGIATCQSCTPCLTCGNNIITNQLTSGYYGGEDRVKPNSSKCSHGGPLDSSTGGITGGINKDSTVCVISPHSGQHGVAAAVAKEATKQFIRDIKALVTPRQLKLLLGVGPTLAISIDTTGSMGGIINSVKQQAIQIVNNRLGTDEEPSKYVLAPFNDPSVGPVTVTDDANAFKSAISALFADGGGDCPELSMTGMLQGLSASDKGGDLFMFTDASSKDGSLAGNVSSLATSKDIRIYPFLFGSCSPIDPAYIRIANDSGGQLFFLSSSEAGNITKLADFVVRSSVVNLLSIGDSLLGTPKTYMVPVDSTMTKVTFSVSGATSVVVRRPDGTTVLPSDTNVSFISLSSGAIYSITNPPAGNWSVTINGTGNFSVAVSGESLLDLSSFRFVEPGGRPGHEGFFPIAGLPEAGGMSTVDAVMSGDFSTAQFELRTKAGAVLQTLGLTQGAGVAAQEFFGDVTLPNAAFLVYVTGSDINGKAYQRVLPGIIKPQTIKIIAPLGQDLHPSQTTTYTFQVKNLGPTDTFVFSGADDQSFLQSITPTTFTLDTNAIKTVAVRLQPPINALPGTSDTLTVTVQSTTSDTNNFAVVTSTVASNCQPVTINCPAPITTVTARPGDSGVVVNYTSPTVTGDCAPINIVCSPPSNTSFPVGTTTVTCTATDASSNTSSCSFTVNVFSFCLQDETNAGNIVLVNAKPDSNAAASYIFFCGGLTIASGQGTLTTRGGIGSIEQNKGDRRVLIQWDTTAQSGKGAGTATVMKVGGNITCQITDRDMSNNPCTAPQPSAPERKVGKGQKPN